MRTVGVSRIQGILAITCIAGLAACATESDSLGPELGSPESGVLISATLEGEDTVAYVSLAPGTVPGGLRAVVRNLRSGSHVESMMQDGGLDPVRLPSSVGDSVEVETHDEQDRIRRFGGTVAMSRPPVVVRTGPMRGATDAPLNSIVVVVFSAPMLDRTITRETITVTRSGQNVPSDISLSADGLRAEVQPSELLPDQEYSIAVSREAQSREGVPLGQEYRSSFRTANVAPLASVEVLPADTTVQIQVPVRLSVLLRDADGKVVTDRRVTWSVQGPATLGTDTTVRISEPAGVTVTATAEGKVGVGRLTAQPLRFASISAGTGYTCGLVVGGWVYCWGLNEDGQLGVGDREWRTEPTPGPAVPCIPEFGRWVPNDLCARPRRTPLLLG